MVRVSVMDHNTSSVLENSEALAIIQTVREPVLILDRDLRVNLANQAFYDTFKVTPKQTEKKLIYKLGNGQWNIPKLKTLLEEILPKKNSFDNYEITHDFVDVGHKTMLLNARQLRGIDNVWPEIFLVIEDITTRKK